MLRGDVEDPLAIDVVKASEPERPRGPRLAIATRALEVIGPCTTRRSNRLRSRAAYRPRRSAPSLPGQQASSLRRASHRPPLSGDRGAWCSTRSWIAAWPAAFTVPDKRSTARTANTRAASATRLLLIDRAMLGPPVCRTAAGAPVRSVRIDNDGQRPSWPRSRSGSSWRLDRAKALDTPSLVPRALVHSSGPTVGVPLSACAGPPDSIDKPKRLPSIRPLIAVAKAPSTRQVPSPTCRVITYVGPRAELVDDIATGRIQTGSPT